MMNTVIIGPGRSTQGCGIGLFLARELINHPFINLRALVGRSLEKLNETQQTLDQWANENNKFNGDLVLAKDVEDYFSQNQIDLCVVCTPDATHAFYIELALQNNVHVLTEKPLIQTTQNDITGSAALEKLSNLTKDTNKKIITNVQRIALLPQILDFPYIKNIIDNDVISSIEASIKIAPTAGKILSATDLFDLLIDHPLGFLVSMGIEKDSFCINSTSFENNESSVHVTALGSLNLDRHPHANTHYKIDLVQTGETAATTLTLSINHYPIHIELDIQNNVIRNKLTPERNPEQAIYVDDALKQYIDNTVQTLQAKPYSPRVIDTERSLQLFKLHQKLKKTLFK